MGMPFKQKQYIACGAASIPQYMFEKDEQGKLIKKEDTRELPDPETFSTKNVVNAGRDLGQPVNPVYNIELGSSHEEPQGE